MECERANDALRLQKFRDDYANQGGLRSHGLSAFTVHHSGIPAEWLLDVLLTDLFSEAYFYFRLNYKFAQNARCELNILSGF